METPKIFESEYRFCLILWEKEPITAAEFAKLCARQLGWKRSTTYTVIKCLWERGVLKNEQGTVTSLISKADAQACEIDELMEKKFEGSLPAFLAAFTKRRIMQNPAFSVFLFASRAFRDKMICNAYCEIQRGCADGFRESYFRRSLPAKTAILNGIFTIYTDLRYQFR